LKSTDNPPRSSRVFHMNIFGMRAAVDNHDLKTDLSRQTELTRAIAQENGKLTALLQCGETGYAFKSS
jgi:hypothetical protein